MINSSVCVLLQFFAVIEFYNRFIVAFTENIKYLFFVVFYSLLLPDLCCLLPPLKGCGSNGSTLYCCGSAAAAYWQQWQQ
jgi:hypothetical protein